MEISKAFSITGVANVETADTGITSTEAEKKKLLYVVLWVSVQIANLIRGYIEREKVLEYYDYHIDTHEGTGSDNAQKSANKLIKIPVNVEIDVGKTFNLTIACGGTLSTLKGSYVYELI